jgi:hypothetical protein
MPQEEQQREFVLGTRGAVREGGQQRQSFGQGGDRVVMGITPAGIVCYLLAIVYGTLDLATALEVDSELGGNFLHLGSIAGLQTDPNAPV